MWLIFCLVVLWTGFSEAFASITLTLFVPLSLAALGIVLRGSSFAFRKEVFRTSSQRNYGAAFAISSVLVRSASARSPARSPRVGCPRAARPATPGPAGSTPRRSWAGCSRSSVCAYLRGVLCSTPAGSTSRDGRVLPAAGGGRGGRHRRRRVRRHLRPARRRPYIFDGLTSRALPLVIVSALCGVGSLVLRLRNAHRGALVLAIGAVATVVVGWGVAQWPYMLPETLKVEQAAAPVGHARRRSSSCSSSPRRDRARRSACCTYSTRRACSSPTPSEASGDVYSRPRARTRAGRGQGGRGRAPAVARLEVEAVAAAGLAASRRLEPHPLADLVADGLTGSPR